jgi:hypothetical protein
MEQKVSKFYRDKRWAIIVRFLERRLSHSSRIVPGTFLERYSKVWSELARRGRYMEIYNLMLMIEGNYWPSAKWLSIKLGIPIGTIKQTRRRLKRVERELELRGELYPKPSMRYIK